MAARRPKLVEGNREPDRPLLDRPHKGFGPLSPFEQNQMKSGMIPMMVKTSSSHQPL